MERGGGGGVGAFSLANVFLSDFFNLTRPLVGEPQPNKLTIMRYKRSAGLKLGQRLRRWPNIKLPLARQIV